MAIQSHSKDSEALTFFKEGKQVQAVGDNVVYDIELKGKSLSALQFGRSNRVPIDSGSALVLNSCVATGKSVFGRDNHNKGGVEAQRAAFYQHWKSQGEVRKLSFKRS
jgi:hypothetical protein